MNNDRQKQIINILVKKNKIISGEDLCSEIGVSSRTVRSDIKSINDLLNKHGAQITSEKGKGYIINIEDEEKLKLFLNGSDDDKEKYLNLTSKERAEYIIMRLLLNELEDSKPITQIELADELYISLSALKNDLKLSKWLLEKSNLKIVKSANRGITIVGDEVYLRKYMLLFLRSDNKFFLNNFIELLKGRLGEDSPNIIKNILVKHLEENHLILTEKCFENLIDSAYIVLMRATSNKLIKECEELPRLLEKESAINISEDICKCFEEAFDIDLPREVVYYITRNIVSSNIITKKIDRYNSTHSELNGWLIDKILEAILKVYNVDFTKDNLLRKFIDNDLQIALNRCKYDVKIQNEMLPAIKNNYRFAFELGILANKIVNINTGLVISEDDIGFLTVHFATGLERLKTKKSKIKRVIITCTTGVGVSLLLKTKLERKFKDKLEIVNTVPLNDIYKHLTDNIDLIITTVPFEASFNNIIYVRNLLDSKEVDLISNIINESSGTEDLCTIFHKELFDKSLDLTNKEDILENMTEKLVKLGYINDKIRGEIIEREKLSSTEIGDLTAIPHTISSCIKESFIYVAILKKSITWDVEKVQIVFLVGIAKNDKELPKKILEGIYKKIINIDLILQLIKSNDFEEFIRLID